MVARALIIVLVNAAFLIGVLWYMPIDGLLTARGYTPQQIAALQSATPPAATAQAQTAVPEQSAPAGEQESPAAQTAPATPAEAAAGAETESTDSNAPTGSDTPPAQEPDTATAQNETQTEAAAQPPEPAPPQRLRATDTINVRAGQSTDHEVVGQVDVGDVVTVLDDPGGDWIQIEHGDVRGWAYRPLFETPDEDPGSR